MSLRFDGNVAVVTGAGNGIGKEYAKLLGSLGAKVVVNDLGGSIFGEGSSSSAAEAVVLEIRNAGGEAVANSDSVTDGDKIVETAISAFGRIDIVINNAGIVSASPFRSMTDKDWDLVYEVHCKGSYKVTRAAWPHMLKNGCGRIVNISSVAGLYGEAAPANYCAMKAAALGFTFALAKEGARNNIQVNAVAPVAASRMLAAAGALPEILLTGIPPENIAKFVVYLCHESCPATGQVFELAGRWMSRVRWERSAGVAMSDGFTVDDVGERFAEICDMGKGTDHPPETGQSSTVKALEIVRASSKIKSKL